MNQARIEYLLDIAALEAVTFGAVTASTQARLVEAGYIIPDYETPNDDE